ncbi:MAG: S1C family serine protease, partial [Lachnospiraceae bacterium]|nr:S1C family serine protease [Lachnospiraceae bacterium]
NIVKESDPDKALAGDEKATDEAGDKGKGDPASKEGRVEDKDPSKVSLKTEESPEEKSQEEKSEEEAKENLVAKEELEVSDYTVLYKKIGDVAKEVRSSMVTVAGISPDTDWFMNSYENNNRAAGLILADNGKELLILTKTSVLNNANSIQVTFSDGNTYTAGLKTSDSNTNFSVIAIQLNKLKEETLETMTMANLGSSRGSSITGKPVIAVGDPLGVSDSIAIGQITSNAIVINMSDSNVGILTTDIYGSSKASGVLCDFEGRILGIICQDGSTIDAKNLIRAYAISDLKIRLEKILNGQEIAYLGIKGTDVTKEAMEELGIPKGAYVKEVIADSPAMRSGIQNGDVIVKLGTDEIASFGNYMDSILKYQPGETITLMVKRLGKEDYVDISYEIELGDAD